MSDVKLGSLIDGDAERDAVHVAVVPLIAHETMYKGDYFKLLTGSQEYAIGTTEHNAIGIVDPFLSVYSIQEGSKFWGFLFPNTVTGMRHHWQHPSFDREPVKMEDSALWLHQFCDKWRLDFGRLIDEAQQKDGYIVADGIDLHCEGDLGEDGPLFWHHLEKYLGKKIPKDDREDFGWSCSC